MHYIPLHPLYFAHFLDQAPDHLSHFLPTPLCPLSPALIILPRPLFIDALDSHIHRHHVNRHQWRSQKGRLPLQIAVVLPSRLALVCQLVHPLQLLVLFGPRLHQQHDAVPADVVEHLCVMQERLFVPYDAPPTALMAVCFVPFALLLTHEQPTNQTHTQITAISR